MTTETTQPVSNVAIPDGKIEVHGELYMRDARGSLVPVEMIKASDLLEHELVQKVIGFGKDLSDQISRFKGHTFTDLGEFDALLAQEYNLTKGGPKGNRTYLSYDGLSRVSVRVADLIEFGPQLQTAKVLVDECLNEWSADSRAEIRAVVTRAFNTDREGKINRSEIFTLLRLDITDPRWLEAMRAVRDAMRIVGSKVYLRLETRTSPQDKFSAITIDLAAA